MPLDFLGSAGAPVRQMQGAVRRQTQTGRRRTATKQVACRRPALREPFWRATSALRLRNDPFRVALSPRLELPSPEWL